MTQKLRSRKGERRGYLTLTGYKKSGKIVNLDCQCGDAECLKHVKISRVLYDKHNILSCAPIRSMHDRKNKILNTVADPDSFKDIEKTPMDRFYLSYLRSALSRSISFNLTIQQFTDIVTKPCAYCGCNGTKRLRGLWANGVDRVNSLMDYSVENSVPCCGDCNMAKGSKTPKDFLEWAKRLADFQNIAPAPAEDKGPPFEPTHTIIGGSLYSVKKSHPY